MCVYVSCSVMFNSVTPWTVTHQAPLSMGFSRQEFWSGCHALLQGIFQPRDRTQVSCIAGRFFTIWATREDLKYVYYNLNCGLRMLLQRSKCHIDYKIQKYFALWKYTVQNASHRLAGCYFIVSCVLPSSTWNLLLWFWNSYSASHTKSLWRRNK